jgi:queuine tRNA-ribosyltransferase/7-cyano-7-deazaguanine tRNA-ribosyltransferase
MIEFKIVKKSKCSLARFGVLKTSRGEIETPCFVPVATQGVVKTLTSEETESAKCRILIANAFHLHLKPGEQIIKTAGGLHEFMNWDRPLMTDSGGYQVFSLGFGKDLGVGKIINSDTNARIHANDTKIKIGQQPKNIKITNNGVRFRSPVDGRKLFIGPKESIKIQQALGADIIFAFDECTPPTADYKYTQKSLEKTHKWAIASLKIKNQTSKIKNKQAIFGIIQGGKFKDLRIESAKFIGSLPFDGFGIGGEFGGDKKTMTKMVESVIKELPESKPRHLLGIGHPEDILKIVKSGIDTFDCVMPTHYARHGVAFINANPSGNKLDLNKSKFLKDKNPLDKKCGCMVCQNYRRNYISHLLKAKEITALRLLTFHNLYFFNSLVEEARNEIKKGKA